MTNFVNRYQTKQNINFENSLRSNLRVLIAVVLIEKKRVSVHLQLPLFNKHLLFTKYQKSFIFDDIHLYIRVLHHVHV